jgi:hypothetical protein
MSFFEEKLSLAVDKTRDAESKSERMKSVSAMIRSLRQNDFF